MFIYRFYYSLDHFILSSVIRDVISHNVLPITTEDTTRRTSTVAHTTTFRSVQVIQYSQQRAGYAILLAPHCKSGRVAVYSFHLPRLVRAFSLLLSYNRGTMVRPHSLKVFTKPGCTLGFFVCNQQSGWIRFMSHSMDNIIADGCCYHNGQPASQSVSNPTRQPARRLKGDCMVLPPFSTVSTSATRSASLHTTDSLAAVHD